MKIYAFAALAFCIVSPAVADDFCQNAGQPRVSAIGTIADGQPSYVLDRAGQLIDLQAPAERQLASLAPQPAEAGHGGQSILPILWNDPGN